MKKIHSLWKLIIVLILGIGVISVTAGSMKVEADPENPTGGGTTTEDLSKFDWSDAQNPADGNAFKSLVESADEGATVKIKLTGESADFDMGDQSYIKPKTNVKIYVDLNGHTLKTGNSYFCTNTSGSVNFYDSSKDANGKPLGKIDATGTNAPDLVFEAGGDNTTLTLDHITVNTKKRVMIGTNSGNININNCNFTGQDTVLPDKVAYGNIGGAIYAENKNVKITNSSISHYKVSKEGAAVYLKNSNLAIGDDANDTTDISDNNAGNQGGAIFTTGGNENKYTINLNGGTIENNIADYSGGGIYATGLYDFHLNGGTISGNHAKNQLGNHVDGGGGGIRLSGGNNNNPSHFIMTGGTISGNYSEEFTNADGSVVGSGGGGIKAGHYEPETVNLIVEIRNGTFNGNHSHGEGGAISLGAHVNGTIGPRNDTETEKYNDEVEIYDNHVDEDTSDWGGGGVFVADGGTLLIQKALVKKNHADGFGGGVAGCSTGRIIINSDNKVGTAIFGNKADGDLEGGLSGGSSAKHDDHVIAKGNTVFLNSGYKDYFCALNSTVNEAMLGGGSENWSGSYDSVKINADDEKTEYSASSIMGLDSNASPGDRKKAFDAKRVYIHDNTSGTHGGGILCNGIMVMGASDNTVFHDRLIVSGLKGLVETSSNGKSPVSYADQHRSFDFELLKPVDGQTDSYETVASKNTYEYDNPHNVPGDNNATINKGDKGIINITIPYIVAKKDNLEVNGNPVNNDQMIFYLREKNNGLDYKTNPTVYQIKVDGNQKLVREHIGAENNQLDVNVNQITKVEVNKGSFKDAKYKDDQLVSGTFEASDPNIDYAVKLDTGIQHAKYLWLGIAGYENNAEKGYDQAKKNQDNLKADNQNRTAKNAENGDGTTDFAGGLDGNWGVRDIDDATSYSKDENKSWTVLLQDAFTNEKVKSYSIEKRWTDADNADGLRPAKVKAQLYTVSQDGTLTPYGDVEELKEDADGKLSYTWENLPYGDNYIAKEADEKGNAVEENGAVSDGYTATYKDVNNIEVNAYNHPADGMKYHLLTSDNQPAKDVFGNAVPDLVLNEANNWTGTFYNLDRTANYKVDYAEPITGQTYLYDHSEFLYEGRVVTNMHPQKTTEVGVTKKWMTSDPSSETPVTLDLYADGKKLDDKSVVLDGTPDQTGEDSAWHAKWTDLPANRYDADQKKSVKIAYTVKEATEVNGYVTSYRDQNGKKVKDSTVDGGTIYNTHLIDFTVTKKWEDNNNSDGKRPDQIKVRLRKGTKHYVGETVTLNDENQWTYTWIDLPEYDDNEKKISYTAEEIDLDKNYVSSSVTEGNSTVITNTYNPEKPQKPEETPDTPTVTPQNPNEVKLTIHKTFKGDKISDKDQKNLKFRVTGTGKKTDENGNEVSVKVDETVTYASFINGSYTFYHLYPGEYTVTETNSGVKGYRAEVKYTVDGKTSQKVNAAEAGKEYRIDITDTYHKEKNGSPDTSDHNNVPWNAAVAGIALLIGMTAIIFRKRYN